MINRSMIYFIMLFEVFDNKLYTPNKQKSEKCMQKKTGDGKYLYL